MTALVLVLLLSPPAERTLDLPLDEVVDRLVGVAAEYGIVSQRCTEAGCRITASAKDDERVSVMVTAVTTERSRVVLFCRDPDPAARDACRERFWSRLDQDPISRRRPPPVTDVVVLGRLEHTGPLRWHLDLYTGVTGGQQAVLWVMPPGILGGGWDYADLGGGMLIGGGVGAWSTEVPWLGFAADVSYLHQEGETAQLTFVPLSFSVTFRVPLRNRERYALWLPLSAGGVIAPASFSWDQHLDRHYVVCFGADLRGGLAVDVSPALGIFGELRWLRGSGSGRDDHLVDGGGSLRAYQGVLGLTWRL